MTQLPAKSLPYLVPTTDEHRLGTHAERRTARPRTPELDPVVIHRAIFEGSVESFIQVHRRYDAGVRYQIGKAALKAGRRRDIEDLVQEVWSRLLHDDRRLLRYYDRSRGPFGSFLYCIVWQQAWQLLHRERRRPVADVPSSELDELPDDDAETFIAALAQSDLLRRLLDEVDARLSDHDRALLREHHVHGRTLRSLAEELGVKEVALHKRNQRLKARLAELARQLLAPVSAPSAIPRAVTAALAVLLSCSCHDEPGRAPRSDEPSPHPLEIH